MRRQTIRLISICIAMTSPNTGNFSLKGIFSGKKEAIVQSLHPSMIKQETTKASIEYGQMEVSKN